MEPAATLLLYCEDRKGLVVSIAQFILEHGGNILHADEQQDAALGMFFMRIQWSLSGFDLDQETFAGAFAPLANQFGFTWQVVMGQRRPRVAIFASHYQHCLIDLLYRHQVGEYVHHSFLPAFVGAKPYHAAFQRGVKLIGATSHYVTQLLDEGPIIDQDVIRISHRDRVEDLIGKGRDLERIVLSRAVGWHLEQRILCFGNKTVVFD